MGFYECKLINSHDSEFVHSIHCSVDNINILIDIAMESDYELLIYDYYD